QMLWPWRHRRVERDEERLGAWAARQMRLKPVHPVAHGWRRAAVACGQVVPARPDGTPLWHQHGVAMQHRQIAGVGEGPEQTPFVQCRIGKQGQRVVRMRGQNDCVEALWPPAVLRSKAHPWAAFVLPSANLLDALLELQAR